MAAREQTVELVSTKQIEMFIPILREIDFGDRFLLSMLHWCGIGHRSATLEYWQVWLVQAQSETVGVSGLYRQPGMPPTICWLGWFAIRPEFRRRGFGRAAIIAVCDFARHQSFKELWVYTDAADTIATKFYTGLGFEILGPAIESAPGRTTDDSDIVLKKVL
jgi:ribosomal protein S18 acetylase RimI-like enzyme